MNSNLQTVNSIFEEPWWLDAVAPNQWGSVEIKQGQKIVARLPYVKKRKYGYNTIVMPPYTQTLGYWIERTGAKNEKRFSREKDLITELIAGLPAGYNVDIMLDHNCDYLFPFIWAGFDVKLKYSYRLENIEDSEAIWAGLGANIRTDIKKAMKSVSIEENHSIEDLICLQRKTFERQGRNIKEIELILRRLDEILIQKNARKLLCAVDAEGKIHAAAYFVYDERCCYYLAGGGDPELRNSGAGSLLVWEGIQFAAKVSHSFDFEGSMIKPIEKHFRAFGGIPTPYWHVTKLNLPLSMLERTKPKIKKIIGWK